MPIAFESYVTLGNALTMAIIGLCAWWIRGIPDRMKQENERKALTDSTEVQLRKEMTELNKLARDDIHKLRNELTVERLERQKSEASSQRRGDKLNVLLFILNMVMDRLHAKDPDDAILAQAKTMLARVEDEPHDHRDALHAAEATVAAAQDTVRQVRADETKEGGK